MSSPTTFSESDLRTIRRSFLARKATPEEIRLVLRPKQRSWQMWRMAWFFPIVIAGGMGAMAYEVFKWDELAQLLAVDFWAACCLLVLLHVLVICLLPGVYVGRFELILRPGSMHVSMVGLGFEQRRHAGCCAIVNHRLWCNFTADMIPYALLRRWWQLPLPLGTGAAAIARILAPANSALRDSLEKGGSRPALMDSSRRTLLVKAFGEAVVTDKEIVLLLPPSGRWFVVAAVLGGALGMSAAIMWPFFTGVQFCFYTAAGEPGCQLRSQPLWLPTLLAFLLMTIPCLLADPWVRRALAIVPRGRNLLRIQVGGRIRAEYRFSDEYITLPDWRGLETLASQLYVTTPAWSGYKPAERHFDEFTMANYTLEAWARGDALPWEDDKP